VILVDSLLLCIVESWFSPLCLTEEDSDILMSSVSTVSLNWPEEGKRGWVLSGRVLKWGS
jgi:hypothetical protein